MRGEYLTAYTPYQAEASQGTLQILYEYQTMMASLMGLPISNASLYDGASALAEAILMTVRLHRQTKEKRILVPTSLHPHYREVIKTIVAQQEVEIIEIPYDAASGKTLIKSLQVYENLEVIALVIPQPNFFGSLEEVDQLTDWAHAKNAKVIAVVNPTAMALLKEPGSWGKQGADIACGEGQPLGVPMASGGPYFGFMCCKEDIVRQMPGRIVGRTEDVDGKPGFVLTLQAREQHIRRAKATSNICTNQGLLVTAATIYMSLLGPDGLARVAKVCHANACELMKKLQQIPNVKGTFQTTFFHEFVISLPGDVDEIIKEMSCHGIQAGYSLKKHYPELGNALLVCVTETKSQADLDDYCQALSHALSRIHNKAKHETKTKVNI